MLDGLIAACDAVQSELNERLRKNDMARAQLPSVRDGTDAGKFLATLSGTTTEAQIDAASDLPADAKEQQTKLAQEELRIQATDPAKERTRLESLAVKIEAVAKHVENLVQALNDNRIKQIETASSQAAQLRAAALVASSTTFEAEPVRGVGTDTWRTLWTAAKNFSEAEAYHTHEFPLTSRDARCVLCQQELSLDAISRFGRFRAFMQDTTEQQAGTAEQKIKAMITSLRALSSTPPEITAHLLELGETSPELAEATTSWLQTSGGIRDLLIAYRVKATKRQPPHQGHR
jgi:hypothetical protein